MKKSTPDVTKIAVESSSEKTGSVNENGKNSFFEIEVGQFLGCVL